jgi:hypothetical protein
MPRAMPPLARRFASAVDDALDLARDIETARIHLMRNPRSRGFLRVFRVELLYELAFLMIFVAWEDFLEQSFLRYLCGFASAGGQAVLKSGKFRRSIADAERAILGRRQYALWHSPITVISRCRGFFSNGIHSHVIASIQSRLECFSSVRHRIAHAQADAKRQFDAATMHLAGRRYAGARPGRFLRDWAPNAVQQSRWLETIADELKGLAHQIVP